MSDSDRDEADTAKVGPPFPAAMCNAYHNDASWYSTGTFMRDRERE